MNGGLKLKIKTGGLTGSNTPSARTPGPIPTATPIASTPGGGIKIKIKTGSARSTPVPPTPESSKPEPLKKTKAGRQPKASAKVVESRKRRDDHDSDDEGSTIQVLSAQPPAKKIKLSTKASGLKTPSSALAVKTPTVLKAKQKGEKPKRNPGEGYDSEASDNEDDPAIEEQFILRMLPGPDCDYLREAIANKTIGTPKSQGGPDIHMKFFHADGRRGAITVNGHIYASTLVDLPCIIEGMKSWDKRGWWKSADICQMLWVFARVNHEDEAKTIELPRIIDQRTFQYPHGLTPPMHYARKRRFRKRISRTAIEAVEDAVEALFAKDKECKANGGTVTFAKLEQQRTASEFSERSGTYDDEDGDEDAEGEDDEPGYFNNNHHGGNKELSPDLEADLEAEMQEDSISAAATPVSLHSATPLDAETLVEEEDEDEDSGDESVEEDDDEDDDRGIEEVDEEERARQAEIAGLREDVADMERQIASEQAKLAITTNAILKRRVEELIRKLKQEVQLKKTKLGEDD